MFINLGAQPVAQAVTSNCLEGFVARMQDIAKIAGVSVTTVSHVVNNTRHVEPDTRQRVLDAMKATAYRHNTYARALARGGTQSIGVALSVASNPYFAEIVGAIEKRVTAQGSVMLLGETHEDPSKEFELVDTLLRRRVDGLILAPTHDSKARTLPALREAGVPTVLIDRLLDAEGFDQVGSQNTEPMAELVDHLAGHGHKRIALIAGRSGLPTTIERHNGYRVGMRRNHILYPTELVVDGGSHRDSAAAAMAHLWDLDARPTAVIAANNFMSVGVLNMLNERKVRVPEDIAVAGYDDFEWAELMAVPLTAVAQDWRQVASRAVDLLFKRIANPEIPPRSQRIATKLQLRTSCGC